MISWRFFGRFFSCALSALIFITPFGSASLALADDGQGAHKKGDTKSGTKGGTNEVKAHAHGAHRPAHHHSFDPERFVKRWEGPQRDQEQRPAEVLKACGVTEGMSVVDLGAGTGYFLPHLSRAVGGSGQVQALDLEPKMVAWMQARVKKEQLSNVTALTTPAAQTPLQPASVDRILIVNVWHHIDQRASYLKHLVSRLKPGGALCVVEIKLDAPHGPPRAHRLSPDELIAELSQAPELRVSLAPLTLPHQHLVIGELR